MTSTPITARDRVEELLALQGAGKAADAADLFAAEVDFHIPNSRHLPWVPQEPGSRASMRKLFESLGSLTESRRFEVFIIVGDADNAVVLGEFTSVVLVTGRTVTSKFALWVTLHDGMITRYHLYEDSFAMAQAAR
ncbi:nuclear transport factor 2 family protein [Rhodococcus pyridinivorans]|uniref:SnoaL-like domain-containing protein n=1 Tax=Rhodococcus pyridinivorans KG-16 TaxID=1441730 RepID=A0A0V9UEV8_9NOCA|nr:MULTISPECIES: nuclear transport factor 2 family protein [Rhodococcus]KSZ56348.1 hypothetical protein Z045_23750 [Rhodococcus pyridinivorans KG-16]